MMKKDLFLVGGGGHCKACIDVIESVGDYNIKGILDQMENLGSVIHSYPVIGTDRDIPALAASGAWFLITVGQIMHSSIRKSLFQMLVSNNARIATIISSLATVSKYSKIGLGSIIMHNTLIGPDVIIGNNCIINNKADIEHDTIVGNHVHISTNVIINGTCKIGNECFIGSNTTIIHGVNIPNKTIIGAGTVILKSLHESGKFVGNPSKKID